MPVIREVFRVFWQILGFTLKDRRFGLWLLLVLGALIVVVVVATSVAAPVLIYPVL